MKKFSATANLGGILRGLAIVSAVGGVVVAVSGPAEAQNGSLLRAGNPAAGDGGAGVTVGSTAAGGNSFAANRPASMGSVRQAAAVAVPPNLVPPPGSSGVGAYPGNPYLPQGIPLSGASWMYMPPAEVRTYQKNDIVTIRVDELSRMQAEGNAENRRNALYDALLKDWIELDGLDTVRPAPQANGDPRVQGSLNQLYRADASIESRESLSFNIAARIVDVRPNGDLVLEARKTITVNENVWETSLSGICRPVDIGPDNVVLSRDLLDTQIHKQDRGRLRDGYRRGWFTRWFETLAPF